MRRLIEALCSAECAGRAPGTAGGLRARALVREALEAAGLHPLEQQVPGCQGANLLCLLPGESTRWVLVGAHLDHLGEAGGRAYPGADDNAAAVAVLVRLGAALARQPPAGRGVLLAVFDGEEPPYFLSEAMGSEYFASHPSVALDSLDLMVCMDLVGHALGPEGAPAAVRETVFALGAERSAGTAALLDGLAGAEPGVVVRRVDAETIPPLSDYWAFWRRRIPFLFLTNGRWRHYHTPDDTPDRLDFPKMEATARWLERFVRAACARPEPRVGFLEDVRDDASTLRTLLALAIALAPVSPLAAEARTLAEALLAECDAAGRLPETRRPMAQQLVAAFETALG